MNRKSIFILFAILILGFLVRIYRITEMPMYGDELTIVYDTYSILKTGNDATGQTLPITFKMGAGRQGGYIYGSLPFIYLFGPTELGVRSLSLLSGLGIIILMYFLGTKLFKNEKIGLLASFLTSISMWDIYLSRGGFEAHFALFLALLGIVSFLHKKYVIWAIVWGLALLTYPTFKLTLPLIFLSLLWYQGSFKEVVKNKIFIISIVILSLFGVLVIKETLINSSEQRFFSINIFSDKSLEQSIIQHVNSERNLTTFYVPFFYNRPLEYSRILIENYINSLSPKFLYLRGDGNPRHNPGEWGMFYLIEIPLLFMGIVCLWKENKKLLLIFVLWIMITPLATMFLGDPHALRNDLMILPFILLSAYGLSNLSPRLAKVFILIMFIQLIFVLQRVYFLAPNKFAGFWSAEAKKQSLIAITQSKLGKQVVLSTKIDNIEYAYEVYAKVDPNLAIKQYGKSPKVFGNVVITDK